MMPLPTRILLVVENNPYPQDFRVRREAETLVAAGCRVEVVAPRGLGQPWTEDVRGVKVSRYPAPPGGGGALSFAAEFALATLAIWMLVAWIWLRRGIDIIHAANPPDTLFVIGATFKLLGVRYVFDQHDLSPETYLSRFGRRRSNAIHRVLLALERGSYLVADLVICPNDSYRRLAIERGGICASKVVVVRNGPPLSFVSVPADPHISRRAPFLLGYVGTIGPQDGLDHLVKAVHALIVRRGRRDVLAIVMGDGDALDGAIALADELGVSRHLWFTGRLSEMEVIRHLSAVHVCLQPDPPSPLNDNSTMNKLMEYMALEKPTVAYDLTETRYSAGGSARLVRPGDVVAFAEAIDELLGNDGERIKLGAVGRRRVEEELAWEYSASRLVDAYRQHLGAHVTERGTSLDVSKTVAPAIRPLHG